MLSKWLITDEENIDIKCPVCQHQIAPRSFCEHTIFVYVQSSSDDSFFDYMRSDFEQAWEAMADSDIAIDEKGLDKLNLGVCSKIYDVTKSSKLYPTRVVAGFEELSNAHEARSMLDQLLTDSQLYTKSKDYQDLLDFVVKLRNFAPFNAMLLQVQKPGLSYAASAHDWKERFGRTVKEGSRPLLILWPFGPVSLVYDEMDTEGNKLPEDVSPFVARGKIDESKMNSFIPMLSKKKIEWEWLDAGGASAGYIRSNKRTIDKKEEITYEMYINKNHTSPVQFATLTHELGHMFLGHLGPNKSLNIPDRLKSTHKQRELEAESVSYIVCARNGVESKSQTYLKNYVEKHTTIDEIDIYNVMRAAGQVETLLGLTDNTKCDNPKKTIKQLQLWRS